MNNKYCASNSNFVYRMNRLDESGKKGILTPDEDGCYTMCIGALEHASRNTNSKGVPEYYTSEGYEKFFSPGTLFNDRIKGGFIKAEYGHPDKKPGMSDIDFLERNLVIKEKNVCATFHSIWLVDGYIDPLTNEKCVGIFAKFKPSGPYGKYLEQDLKDKGSNVCFSIRSLTTRKNINGRMVKVLHTVVTFDYVNEPGITCAEKLLSPSLENRKINITGDSLDVEINKYTATKLLNKMEKSPISIESGYLNIIREIVSSSDEKEEKRRTITKTFDW